MGIVNEVLPKEKLMARAWELAEVLAAKPALATRFARTLLVQELRRKMLDMQGYGLALEGLANLDDDPSTCAAARLPGTHASVNLRR